MIRVWGLAGFHLLVVTQVGALGLLIVRPIQWNFTTPVSHDP